MMNQTVQQTTQKLIDLLPVNEQYYRLDELRSWGYPAFIVQRIQVELERNLAESMIIPTTDWANIQSDAVQNAWQQFVQAIRDEARLPASYAKAVIETAAADVLDMLTEPRKNIPDVIFGSDDELDYEKLQHRAKAVVVYPHFARLLSRYMQKKELDVLSRNRCESIIQKADERLTGNYSPLNWAQMLDPLFNLLDDEVDPSLLRLFFEDKERPRLADIFDRRDDSLNRAEFIEILSAPDLLDTTSGDESPDTAAQMVEEAVEEEKSSESETSNASVREMLEETEKPDDEAELLPQEKDQEADREQDTVTPDVDSDEADDEHEVAEEESGESFLNTGFAGLDVPLESMADSNTGNGSEDSISAIFNRSEEQDPEPVAEEQSELTDEQDAPAWEESDEEEGEDPMWMRFMSEDEKEALEEEESIAAINFEEESSGKKEEEWEEEPIIDLTEEDEETDDSEEIQKLEQQFSDRHDHFVEAIFGGSEQAYNEALQNIASFDTWREASKYIQKDVFRRNLVDLYSESAVAFTDRLQSYFLEKEGK